MQYNPSNVTEKKAVNKMVKAINNLYKANQMFISPADKVDIEILIDALIKTIYNSNFKVELVPGKGYKLAKIEKW